MMGQGLSTIVKSNRSYRAAVLALPPTYIVRRQCLFHRYLWQLTR